MIGWTVAAARAATLLDGFAVSTEDPEIAAWARVHGVRVIDRPVELAKDDTPDLPVMQHALGALVGPAALAWLRPTYPFRTGEDIDAAIRLWVEMGASRASSVRSVVPVKHHPWKCYRGNVTLLQPVIVSEARLCQGPDVPRQSLERVWACAGAVDVVSVQTIRDGSTEGARIVAYPIPVERALDIDTPDDLAAARLRILGVAHVGNAA